MFLGFDIGNTNTVLGIYPDDSIVPATTFRFETVKNTDPDELGKLVKGFLDEPACDVDWSDPINLISGIAFSSVVPEINSTYHEMALSHFGIDSFEINHESKLSFKISYPEPKQLGVDRIVNIEAAYREYGEEVIVIDIGTAATFCVIEKGPVFDGGIIAPGIGTTIKALSENASQLPPIDFEKPERLVAQDTVNAIKSGFFYGWLSLIEGIISRIERENGKTYKVVLTGGFAQSVADDLGKECIVDSLLTMKGIRLVHELNQ